MTKPSKLDILVFPKDSNPYQDLLYESIPGEIAIHYLYHSPPTVASKLFILPTMILKLGFYKLKGYKILHIHWLYPFSLPKKIPFAPYISYVYTLLFLEFVKLFKYEVVWTVHNVLPHEKITSDDLRIRRLLADMASCKIVHSDESIRQMERAGISVDNVETVPIGNYIEVHPEKTNKVQARSMLNIDKDTFVIIFFGAVRNGKGLEKLIEVFINLPYPDIQLVIAGKCNDDDLNATIDKAARVANISFINNYIPDRDVSKYIKSSDIFCAPYTENTTSSSVILSMSLGRTVIAPRMGSLKDLPKNTGFFYDPIEPDGLKNSINMAYRSRSLITSKSKNAYKYIESQNWKASGVLTTNIYKALARDTDG